MDHDTIIANRRKFIAALRVPENAAKQIKGNFFKYGVSIDDVCGFCAGGLAIQELTGHTTAAYATDATKAIRENGIFMARIMPTWNDEEAKTFPEIADLLEARWFSTTNDKE